jgi:hypothetical protein
MHPRTSLHQVAFLNEASTTFIARYRKIGIDHVTPVTNKLFQPAREDDGPFALGHRSLDQSQVRI